MPVKYTKGYYPENIPKTPGPMGEKFDEEVYLENLLENIASYVEYVDTYQKDVDTIVKENALDEYAAIHAYESLNGAVEQVVMGAFTAAIQAVDEYNYDLYVAHMMGALQQQWFNLVSAKLPSGECNGLINIEVDLNVLGDLTEWAQAVRIAKEEMLKPGKSHVPDKELASKMWREKIYGAGREGGKVEHSKKARKSKKNPKPEVEYKDVTERYLDAYRNTIIARLSNVRGDQIPWWSLIQYGNSSATGGGGTPYPSSDGFDIIGTIQQNLYFIFDRNYWAFRDEVFNQLRKKLADDYNIEGVTTSAASTFIDRIEDLDDDIIDYIEDNFLERAAETPTHKTIDFVTKNGKVYERYKTSTGKIGLRFSLSQNR